MSDNRSSVVASDKVPITAAWRASRRPGIGQQRRARPPGAGSDEIQTVLNIKTAKALGLEVPPSVFAHADEVIK
jgi:hypothetical protein